MGLLELTIWKPVQGLQKIVTNCAVICDFLHMFCRDSCDILPANKQRKKNTTNWNPGMEKPLFETQIPALTCLSEIREQPQLKTVGSEFGYAL